MGEAAVARFEDLVGKGRYGDSLAYIVRLADQLERTRTPLSGSDQQLKQLFDRICLTFTGLMVTDEAILDIETFRELIDRHQYLVAAFRLSSLRDMDYIHRIMRRRVDLKNNLPEDSNRSSVFLKYLLSYSLYSEFDVHWSAVFARDPEASWLLYLTLVRTRIVLDSGADRRRNELLGLSRQLPSPGIPTDSLQSARRAWMLCSYATCPERHDIKRRLNGEFSGLLKRIGHRSLSMPRRRQGATRPTLAFGAEFFRSGHAMFRCYASYIRDLKTRFDLVLIARRDAVDDAVVERFDSFIEVKNLRQTLGRVKQLQPDIMFYPSLGMDDWTVLSCNLRLAPIQVMSIGHPASSCSPHMDYVVIGTALFGGEEVFSEKVILLRSSGNLFVPHVDTPDLSPIQRSRPDPLRIAVVSKVLKVNAPFMAFCARLESRANRAIQFVFFCDEKGASHTFAVKEIRSWLPNAIIHPTQGYRGYMKELSTCDLRLGTFPFGGANSNVDSFLLGLPSVVYAGEQPHSRTDVRLMRLFRMPEWLAPADEAGFEAAALRLIEDDELRLALSRQILGSDPYMTIFEDPADFHENDYVDLFWWLYEHHEMVQASDKRVWRWEDRCS